ncbi:MAG: hypothetical protein VX569_00005, partial [Pseudomonadota bacterium]|nr:hypothetical protein [Pseudomonadota bacterium]
AAARATPGAAAASAVRAPAAPQALPQGANFLFVNAVPALDNASATGALAGRTTIAQRPREDF